MLHSALLYFTLEYNSCAQPNYCIGEWVLLVFVTHCVFNTLYYQVLLYSECSPLISMNLLLLFVAEFMCFIVVVYDSTYLNIALVYYILYIGVYFP